MDEDSLYGSRRHTVTSNESLTPSTEATGDSITDSDFGKLTEGKYYFEKKEKVTIFGKSYDVDIAIKKPIGDKQRKSYKYFKSNIKSLMPKIEASMAEYVKEHEDPEYAKKNVTSMVDVKKILFPEGRVIKNDEKLGFVILGECEWDDEHGYGVGVSVDSKDKVEFMTGTQDTFF